MRGLRWVFGYSVGEDFDAGDMQIGDVLVSLAGLLDRREFRYGIFGEHLRKSDDLRSELSMIGQHFVGLQDILRGQRIKPGGDTKAVVVLQGSAGGGEQTAGSGLGQERFYFLGACVDQESVGLAFFILIRIYAVVAALLWGKFL